MAACEDQTFKLLLTQANYPNEATFPETRTFCLLAKKLVRSCTNDKRLVLDLKFPEFCDVILSERDLIDEMNCSDFVNLRDYYEVSLKWIQELSEFWQLQNP